MKAWIVINVAHQIEGWNILVQVEKGFLSQSAAENHLKSQSLESVQKIHTEAGDIDCYCVRGVYEVSLEGNIKEPIESFTKSGS